MFSNDQRNEPVVAAVPAGLALSSIRRRAVGAVIDQILVLLPVALGAVIYGYRPGDTVSDDALLVLNVSTSVVALIYESLMIGAIGRTVGKLATGTRVVRLADGGPVGWFSAVQRALVPVVFSAVPQAGWLLGAIVYAFAFLGPLRQGLHDRAAGTLVVLNQVRVTPA